MIWIPQEFIDTYRSQTFRQQPELRLSTQEGAIAFVKERGFVFFWPITGITLPSLWSAVAGDRPVADEHDDPGHVTWGWKDALLGSREWYYAKILRKKSTMLAMHVAPYFYAITENYGAYDEDYLTIYEQGRLTMEAKTVYEILLQEGPLDTIALRRATHMTSLNSESRFNRALTDLQANFMIVPVAVTQAGGWRYAFAYEVTARHYPEIVEQARFIGDNQARDTLAELYFKSVGAAKPGDLTRIFGWKPDQTNRALDRLVHAGRLMKNVRIEKAHGEVFLLASLLQHEPDQADILPANY
jgi:hypothetical protein